ncbi:MAG TPA: GNAT family N-acetyltransferase [Terriglobales bacterium]
MAGEASANQTRVPLGPEVGELTPDCVETESGLCSLAPEWDELATASARPTPFLCWDWILTWWRHFHGSSELMVVTARSPDGRLRGLLPLHIVRRRAAGMPVRSLEFLGHRGSAVCADHLDLLARPEERGEVAAALMREVLRRRSRWDTLVLADLAEDSPLPEALRTMDSSIALQAQAAETCYYRRLPADATALWGEIQRSHPEFVRSLRRDRRRLDRRYQTRFLADPSPAELEPTLTALARLHRLARARQGQTSNFDRAAYLAFHKELIQRLAAQGKLYLARLECDGRIAAVFYGMVEGEVLFFYQSGFDTALQADGVGKILLAEVFEDAITRLHLNGFDFLRGDEAYKAQWADGARHTTTLYGWEPTFKGGWSRQAWRVRQVAARWRGRAGARWRAVRAAGPPRRPRPRTAPAAAPPNLNSQGWAVAETAGLEGFEALAPEWAGLCAAHHPALSPFLHPDWLRAHLQAFENPAKLTLLSARYRGALAAVLPLLQERGWILGLPVRRLRGAANAHSVRFDLVTAAGERGRQAVGEIACYLSQRRGWDAVVLPEAPQGGAADALVGEARARDLRAGRREGTRSLYLDLNTPPLPGLPPGMHATKGSFRTDLRRTRRNLQSWAAAQGGASEIRLVRASTAAGDLAAGLGAFYDLEAAGWKGRQKSAIRCRPATRRFYDQAAAALAQRGTLVLHRLELDGKPIAMDLSVCDGHTYELLKLTYDEDLARFGPGHLLIEAILGECAQPPVGLERFYFNGAESQYKRKWTHSGLPVGYVYIFPRGSFGRLLCWIKCAVTPWARGLWERPSRGLSWRLPSGT